MTKADLINKYSSLLARTHLDLLKLKKEPDPLTRLTTGMKTLPELKERVLLYTEIVKDLREQNE